jgi:hypothetical protein
LGPHRKTKEFTKRNSDKKDAVVVQRWWWSLFWRWSPGRCQNKDLVKAPSRARLECLALLNTLHLPVSTTSYLALTVMRTFTALQPAINTWIHVVIFAAAVLRRNMTGNLVKAAGSSLRVLLSHDTNYSGLKNQIRYFIA